ncbi:hypothetical protein [Paraliomyxa miuraensis]|uniref:hypothetical protein n=1 Tax=Paraliomyxa miuraensis TaxID=376150 RepID=UPI0022589576|nr:hypothetical protein [Paraliomyxa miuraensis]MCX4246821.1 hypothetical protein [Paraliomyxa miuraensis]
MSEARRRSLVVTAALVAAACSTPDSREDTTTAATFPPLTTVSSGTDSTTTDTATGSTMTAPDGTADTTAANDDDAPKFDLGVQPDSLIPEDTGCRKVDFLFAIDNSGSMSAQQTQLLNSFPGFISAIQASLQDTVDSYHVGVVSSDNYGYNQAGCTSIGDLVTQTGGFQAAGQNCLPFAEGLRFATEQDDLGVKFPCVAQIGTSGSPIEQPVTATIAALSDAKAAPGACNEGFLRDDAILVVVVVTDDPPYDPDFDDAHPGTNTAGWYDAVVQAKNGDPTAMVVIGFVPWSNVSCVVFGIESPNLIGFVQSFGAQGVLASVCEPDFGPIFAQTVQTIVSTCENFDPPG